MKVICVKAGIDELCLRCEGVIEHVADENCGECFIEGAKCVPVQSGMVIYLAGPMSNNDHNQYENYNFDEFDRVRDELKILGHHPISPADIDRLFEGWEKYPPADFDPSREDVARFMRRDQNAIEGADAIYMMEGWEHSKGARNEHAYAEFLGKKIMYEIERMV